MFLCETLRRQPQWLVLLEAPVLVGLIGWFDHATGREWSCFAPYAVPIVLVAWNTGRRLGFVFAFLCAATYWVADIQRRPYQTGWGFALALEELASTTSRQTGMSVSFYETGDSRSRTRKMGSFGSELCWTVRHTACYGA